MTLPQASPLPPSQPAPAPEQKKETKTTLATSTAKLGQAVSGLGQALGIFINAFFQKIGQILHAIWKHKVRIIVTLIILVVIGGIARYLSTEKLWVTIPPGHRGVVFDRFGGGLTKEVLDEGTHFYLPLTQEIYLADVTRQSAEVERITADSKEFQDVTLWVNVEFQLNEAKLYDMYREYGVRSIAELTEDIINPNTNEVIKNIIVKYPIGEVLLKQPEIKKAAAKEIADVLEDYYITVHDVDIENILISPAFRQQIAETELAISSRDMEDALLEQAKAASDRELLEAETAKQVTILEAQAIAEYNKLVSEQQISDKAIELKRLENAAKAIEKWDGVLPITTGDVTAWPFN